MEFEADAVRLRDIEWLDELVPGCSPSRRRLSSVTRAVYGRFSSGGSRPAADLVALVELLTNERHRKPLPALIEQHRVLLRREHPLPAVRIRLVLPHRLDARLEQVVVRVALKFGWRLQLVGVIAVRLDSIEIAHCRQTSLVRPNRPEPDTSCQRQSWARRGLLPWCRYISSYIEVH